MCSDTYIKDIEMIKKIAIFLAAQFLVFSSCSKVQEEYPSDGSSYISFSLAAGKTDTEDLPYPELNPDEFSLELENSSGVVFKRWESFSEVKDQKIPLNAGNFKARAWFGEADAIGFEKPYFTGEESFVVSGQQTQEISVTCSQKNVAVKVIFGENVRNDYNDYWATVKLKDSDTLKFVKDETRTGFIPAGDLYFRLHARDNVTGEVYVARKVITAAAADFITFKVDTKPVPAFDVELNITIDASTDDRDVTINIPSLALPKDPPVLEANGFTDNVQNVTEGMVSPETKVNIMSEGGVKKCMITTHSASLLEAGWPESADLASLSGEQAAVLKEFNLSWTESMDGRKLAFVDFSALSEKLAYHESGDNTYLFDIEVVDEYEQTVKASYSINVEKAEFSMSGIAEGDIWASSLYVDVLVPKANHELIVPQVRIPSGEWTAADFSSSAVSDGIRINVRALDPDTEYELRLNYNEQYTQAVSFRTERDAQLGNAGFEDWQSETRQYKYLFSTYYFDFYYPYLPEGDKWWDSNNNETTRKMSTPLEQRYKIFPTTSWTDGRNGGKAAQVMSIAYDGTGVIKANETPGRLFVGVANDQGQVSEKGHAFTSRPTSMEFYYMYDSYSNDEFSALVEIYSGDSLIGSGEFKSSQTVAEWTKAAAEITYTDESVKADRIYVIFVTSTGSAPCRKVDVTIPEGTFNTWAGSRLVIDDMELKYAK